MTSEEQMLDIWKNVSGRPVGPDTDFFDDLEGDSMAAAAIVHWVNIVFGVQLPMIEVFDRPTPAELAGVVDELRAAAR
ncbi:MULTISPECIES: acyl carrier protein [Micromonospora]|uniref:Acyl carrier protein n=1 Tax=Micromonospora rifamycinica TaxID=291594 RepID=A0A1C5HRI6_9ACTN|nr:MULTISPECIES: acyl carrier protein [Micromonospora]WFE65097.1 acyl carrier protein [Micromonospora sp. WMMD714]WFE97469.1 acyl carrier protein [Micromonospora sp. WMMD987]SCG48537.1 Acyl carrier protein [Micromonospora rifamycinica]